jgi:hypothetical protein
MRVEFPSLDLPAGFFQSGAILLKEAPVKDGQDGPLPVQDFRPRSDSVEGDGGGVLPPRLLPAQPPDEGPRGLLMPQVEGDEGSPLLLLWPVLRLFRYNVLLLEIPAPLFGQEIE